MIIIPGGKTELAGTNNRIHLGIHASPHVLDHNQQKNRVVLITHVEGAKDSHHRPKQL